MNEIANEFRNELQSLLDRYNNRLSTPTIIRIAMSIAQPIFIKCSFQEIAEADCDGDVKKCGCTCHKGEYK